MADQILSQEEIDALLTAMDSGEIDVVEDKQEVAAEVRPYDLTTQNIMQRGQFDALEEVYDKFVNLFQSTLSSLFQRTISVKAISRETVKFGEFIKAFSNPTGFIIFGMEPLIGSSLLAFEPNLVFSLIDCMFGGEGKPMEKIREFTMLERRMLQRIAMAVLKDLETAWESAYRIRLALRKIETKPEFVYLVNPSDQLIIVVFAISTESFSGNIHLCMPYLMLEPIKDQLSSSFLREKDRASSFGEEIRSLLGSTEVNLVAELGKTVYSVQDILNFEVDDILRLNSGPQNNVVVNIERVPKYLGMPGVVKGSKAVQITETIDQDRGRDNQWPKIKTPQSPPGNSESPAKLPSASMGAIEMTDMRANEQGKGTENLDLLLDIPLEITIELGRTKMLINDLLKLGQGAVIELSKEAGDTLEILANNRLIAKGDVVVVNKKYGVRLTEVISPVERLEKLG
jgi:flagellar motor switch protein FliM